MRRMVEPFLSMRRSRLSLSGDGVIDRSAQLFENQRLGQMVEESYLPATSNIVFGVVAADRDGSDGLLCTQLFHQVPSSAVRQSEIAQQHIKGDSLGQTPGRSDIRSNVDFVTDTGEEFS